MLFVAWRFSPPAIIGNYCNYIGAAFHKFAYVFSKNGFIANDGCSCNFIIYFKNRSRILAAKAAGNTTHIYSSVRGIVGNAVKSIGALELASEEGEIRLE